MAQPIQEEGQPTTTPLLTQMQEVYIQLVAEGDLLKFGMLLEQLEKH